MTGATSLELPPGRAYLYGMVTGAGHRSSAFSEGQYAQVVNADGYLSAALAYGMNSHNSFTTETGYYDIGGVSVAGSWDNFAAFYGSNPLRGAGSASVSFQTAEESLVVVFGLASSQQFISVEGIPGLEVDASEPEVTMLIAHAYVKPGSFTVVEHSRALSAGQAPSHMADLIGVFVFAGGPTASPVSQNSVSGGLRTNEQGSGGQPAAAVATVTVSAQAGPWEPVLNPALDYGSHDQSPPVPIRGVGGFPLAPGTVLTLSYLAGSVSVGGGWPNEDANGDPQAPLTATSPRSYPSRYLDPGAFPVNVGSLIGAFASNGVVVGRPFKVGDGPLKVIVPAGANELLLGVNDDVFGDNTGAWTVQITSSRVARGISAGLVGLGIAILVLILGVVAVLFVKRPTRAQPVVGAPATPRLPSEVPRPAGTASYVPQSEGAAPGITSDALDKLAKLKSLLDAGLITAEEFREQKARLLGQIR
jgi:hypothetical protein